jgi:hypothetical protein
MKNTTKLKLEATCVSHSVFEQNLAAAISKQEAAPHSTRFQHVQDEVLVLQIDHFKWAGQRSVILSRNILEVIGP